MVAMRALLVLAAVGSTVARWCQVENVKADTEGDFTFKGQWRLDGCTTLSLDHGMCAEQDCPWRNMFEDEMIIQLADALHGNGVLTALSASSNKLTSESVKALAESLRDNEVLTDLNLAHNEIDDNGVVALAEVLSNNPSLTTINLAGNDVSEIGMRALLDVSKSDESALETIVLEGNPKLTQSHLEEVEQQNRFAFTPPEGWVAPTEGDEKPEL